MHPEELVEVRNNKLNYDTGPWIWPKTDQGAWDGPIINWNDGHSVSYFEHLKGYKVVVTAGANCGLHTRYYASKFELVYAFEPHWLNFYCLTRNCPEQNVIKFNTALGDKAGVSSILGKHDTNMGCYTVGEGSNNRIAVLTIDDLGLKACDLIQLDVEGSEGLVLRGAIQTITQYKPVIALETVHQPTLDMLTPLGYIKQEPKRGVDTVFYCT